MATIYELKRRAQELSAKKDSLSISPDEVGGLIDETLDVIMKRKRIRWDWVSAIHIRPSRR